MRRLTNLQTGALIYGDFHLISMHHHFKLDMAVELTARNSTLTLIIYSSIYP